MDKIKVVSNINYFCEFYTNNIKEEEIKMVFNKKQSFFLASLIMLLVITIFIFTGIGCAQTKESGVYPEHTIKIIVPWSAGGGTDLISRQIGRIMEEKLGVPVIIENKTGGGGLVGFQAIANAKPDGYTIGSISISMILQKAAGLGYQDFRGLTPIGIYNEDAASLTVNADAPWNSIGEFVEYCKDNPGTVRVSNSGTGAIWHVSALRMEKFFGIDLVHIPYEGGNPAAIAVAGGHVEVTTTSPPEVASLVNAGKLKILAIPAEERINLFPDIPTFKEEGYDFTAGTWRALAGPAGLPEEVTKKLEETLMEVVKDQRYIDFMSKGGFGIRVMGSDAFYKTLEKLESEFIELFKDINL